MNLLRWMLRSYLMIRIKGSNISLPEAKGRREEPDENSPEWSPPMSDSPSATSPTRREPALIGEFILGVELDKRFLVNVGWRSVVEVVDRCQVTASSPTSVMSRVVRSLAHSPRPLDIDPFVDKSAAFWAILRRSDFLVFELLSSDAEASYYWFNSVHKSQLTSDSVMFRSLYEYVDASSRCVRCLVPAQIAVYVKGIFLSWVPKKTT